MVDGGQVRSGQLNRVGVVVGLAVMAGLAAWAVLALRPQAAREAPEAPQTPEVAPAEQDPAALRYAAEYPVIGYGEADLADPVARLRERLAVGDESLVFDGERGYLDSLLAALEIDAASQLLVFSKTSLQIRGITPETPRAIFFNDATYVAWTRDAPTIEIASMDPNLGPVFYTLEQRAAVDAPFERQLGRCLRCHDSYSLTGGGVPRFILGSGYIGTDGNLVAHEGWILTSEQTPLRNRWGGWYVTGSHGDQVHLGNLIVRDVAALQNLDSLRVGNITDLDGFLDTSPYPARYSDIVALLVIEHQVAIQNLITRVNYDTRTALEAGDGAGGVRLERPVPDVGGGEAAESVAGGTTTDRTAADGTAADGTAADGTVADGTATDGTTTDDVTGGVVADIAEPLVRAMLFADAVELAGPIEGTSGFAEQFEARAVRDNAGRSLRELDLARRVFRYPLSYLIHSEAFDALPDITRTYVYRRIDEILAGEDPSGDFAHLSQADRTAVREILADTKGEFAAFLQANRGATADRPDQGSSPSGAPVLGELRNSLEPSGSVTSRPLAALEPLRWR